MGLNARQATPGTLNKWLKLIPDIRSYERAAKRAGDVGEVPVCAKTLERHALEIGHELAERRDADPLSDRALAQRPANVPDMGVVACDGGRIHCREPGHGPGVHLKGSGWRETKCACLTRCRGQVFDSDPQPDPPACFTDPKHVAKIAETEALSVAALVPRDAARDDIDDRANSDADLENTSPLASGMVELDIAQSDTEALPGESLDDLIERALAASQAQQHAGLASSTRSKSKPRQPADWRPVRLVRTVLASMSEPADFGEQMRREALRRRFFEARVKAFLGDGLKWNWTIWERHFKDFVPILDFIHVLSYLFTTAKAVHDDNPQAAWDQYVSWMTTCWRGGVADVLVELTQWQTKLGPAPDNASTTDPREIVRKTLGYLTNNQSRMKYAEYRTQGLPVTTAWMESLVKEINHRVKGTEMFWNDPDGAEAILQLRAAALSDDNRLTTHLTTRSGKPFAKPPKPSKVKGQDCKC